MGDRAFADALVVFSEDVQQRLSALDEALSADNLEQAHRCSCIRYSGSMQATDLPSCSTLARLWRNLVRQS